MASASQASESDPHERDGAEKSKDEDVTDNLRLAQADAQDHIEALEAQIQILRELHTSFACIQERRLRCACAVFEVLLIPLHVHVVLWQRTS